MLIYRLMMLIEYAIALLDVNYENFTKAENKNGGIVSIKLIC